MKTYPLQILLLLAALLTACSKPAMNLSECVHKADSCYAAADYKGATDWYTLALKSDDAMPMHYYNAACCAAQAQETDKAIDFLKRLQKKDKQWYSRKLEQDPDLMPLHEARGWDKIVATNLQRRTADEARYEHPLYEQLLAMAEEDQTVRQAYIQAYYSGTKEQQDSLLAQMLRTDTLHMQFVDSLLTARGWISRDVVGEANSTIWLVVQHYGLDMWKKYLPIFQDAAANGELDRGAVAMLEDRILTTEGQPQRYGTQCYRDENGTHFSPIADTLHLDSLRASVGLCPMAEYALQIGAEWSP